ALRVASGFVLLLAVVPGLPAIPFLILAAVLFIIARARSRQIERDDRRVATEQGPLAPSGTRRAETAFVPIVVPWSIDVSEDLSRTLDDPPEEGAFGLRTEALALRERLFSELGVPLPSPRVRVAPALPSRHAVVSLFEVPAKVIPVPEETAAAEVVRVVSDA